MILFWWISAGPGPVPRLAFSPGAAKVPKEEIKKGPAMVHPSKSALAYAHQFPPPLPEGVPADTAVIVRYDGVKIDDQDVFYAVLGAADLSRLPDRILRELEFSVRDRDGELRGSPDAFFIGSERHLSLYVNTDAYPDFVATVQAAALERGLILLNGEGDLRQMRGPDGDVSAPPVPAFIENGMGYVPSLLAMSYLDRIRPEADPDAGPDPF
jgi:hypothetical protein